jgi:hypothetical protein
VCRSSLWIIGPLPFNLVVNGSVGPVPETYDEVPGLLEMAPASISIGIASGPAGTNMESDSGDGLMEGF